MILHSLKQIVRGLWKYKSFSIINLLGLSIGIASIIILYLVAVYEESFDKLHSGSENLYRVVRERDRDGKSEKEAAVPYPTAKFLRNEYPGLLATEIDFNRDRTIKISEKAPFSEKNIVFADSLFFKVMDFGRIKNFWIRGNPDKTLDAPNKAILTESTARRYFGNEDPIGKTFRLDNKVDIEVAGLVKDIPATSHLPINMLISYSTLNKDLMAGLPLDFWNFTANGYCYVRLANENTKSAVLQALNAIIEKNSKKDRTKKDKLTLQKLADIHFDPIYENSNPGYTVTRRYLGMLLLLGAFIIFIACINYINLSTSLAFSKSKEIGIRKTIGASKRQLFFHYMSEAFLVTSMAAIIGIVLSLLFIPEVNRLLDKSLLQNQLINPSFIGAAIILVIIISMISGAYPAVILSGFNPIVSLKGQLITSGKSSIALRKALVVFQFTTSISLMICTIVIARQIHYFTNKSLGFNKNAVVEVALPGSDSARIEGFKARLQNQSGIHSVSFCIGAPISDNGLNVSMKAPELSPNTDYNIKVITCDENYLKTYGLNLIAGRWFLNSEEKNLGSAVVVNEETIKTLGYKNPADAIGRKITLGLNNINPAIIGVVKNFHTSSLHEAISSVALTPFPYFYYAAGIRIDPNDFHNTLSKIKTAYTKVYPDDVYKFSFIDETLARSYQQEARDYNLFKAFSAISIFICCIGLWGLIAFVVVRKTKEIGIRKVLGASISGIVGLLSKDFLKLVLVALVVASPIAWYFMHQWLQNFAYRINISWWVFALAGLFAVIIALTTISFQAVRAALANPVKNLRTE